MDQIKSETSLQAHLKAELGSSLEKEAEKWWYKPETQDRGAAFLRSIAQLHLPFGVLLLGVKTSQSQVVS